MTTAKKVPPSRTRKPPAQHKPTGRRPLLTPAVSAAILASLRLGAFDHVAAEAAGVSRRSFYSWIARAEDTLDTLPHPELDLAAQLRAAPKLEGPYLRFLHDVRQAKASARLCAEAAVYLDDPKTWLRMGPGRDRGPGSEGWTDQQILAGPDGGPLAPTVVTIHYTDDWDSPR